MPSIENEQNREIMATVGTIRLFTSTKKVEKKFEAVTFSKSKKASIKYPVTSGFSILNQSSFTGFINNSFVKDFSPQFRFDPVDNSINIEGDIECWGALAIEYETTYSVYLYASKHIGIPQASGGVLYGDEKVGTVFSRVGFAMATLDMPPAHASGRQPKTELYRITSEYLATPKGEMEKPEGYPENREHENGFKVPNKNNSIILTRTHEIVSLAGTEYTGFLTLYTPYNGANVFWRPKFKFTKASPPQGYQERRAAGISTWDDRSWDEVDWDAIKSGVKSRYPDIEF